MADYIDIVSVKAVIASGALKVEVNEIGNILLIDPRSKESVKIGCLADVDLVRHGRWEMYFADKYLMCSACKASFWDENGDGGPNYCPNCGAKMDGEERENGRV